MKNKIRPPVRVDANERVIARNDKTTKVWRWRLNVPGSITGTRKQRLFFETQAAANQKREDLLSVRERNIGEDRLKKLAERGMTIEDAVQYAIDHAPLVTTLKFSDLLEKYALHRENEVGVSERYLATLKSYIKKIKDSFKDAKLSEVSTAQLREFLTNLKNRDGTGPASADSRNHYLETFNAVFNFAKRERILSVSPSERISKTKTDDEDVEILSIEQVSQVLALVSKPENADIAPGILLQLFAAPRRSELMCVPWDVVTNKYLRLDKVKRGTKKRSVEMPEALLEWIAPFRKNSGYVFEPKDLKIDRECDKITDKKKRAKALKKAIAALENAYTYRLDKATATVGLVLPKNALRHTAITMRVNITGDISATSLWSGNSPTVIRDHYQGVATEDDAKRFYALKPPPKSDAPKTKTASPQTTG